MLKYAPACAKYTKQKGKSNGKNGSRGVMAASHFPFWEVSLLLDLLSGSWLPCWLSICLANNSKSSSFCGSSCLLQLTLRPISISSLLMSDVPWEESPLWLRSTRLDNSVYYKIEVRNSYRKGGKIIVLDNLFT